MKRYQCIKNVEMLALVGVSGSNGQIAFRQGEIYSSNDKHIKDEYNNTWSVNHPTVIDSFHELPPIEYVDIDETDHESNEYVALQPVHGCLRFIAFGIAISATLGIFIYLALTWRS